MNSTAEPSPPLNALRERLAHLRESLLPSSFDPLGNYSPEQLTKTHAFRVLSHAELERFIEERARDIVLASTRNWKKHRSATRPLLCLLAFSGRTHEAPPATLEAPQPNQRADWEVLIEVDRRIDVAVKAYFGRLSANHGVKEENVLGLLVPVGVARADLDPQLLVELNSFGIARGESAHLGAHVTAIPDPQTEYNRVQQILKLLEPLDICLTSLVGGSATVAL